MSASTQSASPASGQGAAFDDRPLVPVRRRGLLLLAVMMVSVCQFFDATIANVALPHMRVSLGASADTISWVLTSFILAGAIFTPMTGWLSDRVGSRNLFIGSAVMFLVTSALCGAATTLPQMVAFRALQGMSSAFLGPLTQTIMFDVSPPSKQAATMSQFGMLVMIAPITGPFLGGFLTESLNWRWVFYVNLPIGIPALAILWWLLPSRPVEGRRLDVFGFTWIAITLGALQLMLDRGQGQDWFSSWEIIIEGLIAIAALWIFVVHSMTTSNPLFPRELFRNPSFMAGLAMMLVLGLTNVALSAVLPTMYQMIYHYPVIYSGLLMAPRGLGVIVTSLLSTLVLRRLDFRITIFVGYMIAAWSVWLMTTWSLDMDAWPIVFASFIQGMGLGLVFAPMNLAAFATIKPELRPDGSSLLALSRNLGGSFGISLIVTMLARNQQISHSDIAANVTATSVPGIDLPGVVGRLPGIGDSFLAMIEGEITRQAAMVAYIDNFYAMTIMLLVMAPVPFLLRRAPVPAKS
jgi:MFS transporter, DHA2 family, multidrug resistance protein